MLIFYWRLWELNVSVGALPCSIFIIEKAWHMLIYYRDSHAERLIFLDESERDGCRRLWRWQRRGSSSSLWEQAREVFGCLQGICIEIACGNMFDIVLQASVHPKSWRRRKMGLAWHVHGRTLLRFLLVHLSVSSLEF